MNDAALFLAVLLACMVEAVEATTIVLAAGSTRDWRSALSGVAAGVLTLAVVVAIAGPAISLLPLGVLRLVVGGLLLVFGLQWLRKAVLRASGYKPLHDEQAIYQKQVEAARAAGSTSRYAVRDWYAFTLSFKGVVLEGLEVVFIVLTFGTNQHNIPLATAAAAVAVIIVVILGIAVRGPLSRVPENTLKFIVGVMLTAFGAFWSAEGAGAVWPGGDVSLLILAPAIAVFALALTGFLRRRRLAAVRMRVQDEAPRASDVVPTTVVPTTVAPATVAPTTPGDGTAPRGTSAAAAPTLTAAVPRAKTTLAGRLKAFGMFWYDFVIGDDWQIAAGVVVALALIALLGAAALSWLVAPIAVAVLLPYGIWRALRPHSH